MDIKLVTAIFPRDRLEAVEEKLRRMGVERVDVSKVRGYGEYRNFYARDWMIDEIRLQNTPIMSVSAKPLTEPLAAK